uniref:CRAL-TRIO domain-containing protein n=1 Tax=Chromera velia CCMP2878 TaxID=1169474 RepID=A0A0G4HCL8_9ALVE|eukprot:Cvel_26107.t1-p1 / transcript=Cvel_26107.t1 / gene=Cvel_26107 / organism=Chromera_velia_CCMP2878 / gene_product=SEC14-like protein 5, putative / transcript_product=SEC14-like protein 5, putative / location=Cvel_scaffold3053:7565-11905(+) / protein_length=680 / sequence_SO=supercontig / SO=protein_coding / is_pseudo=false
MSAKDKDSIEKVLALENVAELLQQKKETILEITQKAQKILGTTIPEECDSIHILRYALSFDNTTDAAKALTKAIEWRSTRSDLVKAARNGQGFLPDGETEETFREFCIAGFHGRTQEGHLVYIIRSGLSNMPAVLNSAGRQKVTDFLTLRNEIGFHQCDKLTRETGYLHKVVVLLDMRHSSLSNQDFRFLSAYGESSKRSEFLHPQLLGQQIVLNPPGYVSMLWDVGRKMMSKRTLRKICMQTAPATETTGDSSKSPSGRKQKNVKPDDQIIMRVIAKQDLPSFLGGDCHCAGGCIGFLPNEATSPNTPQTLKEKKKSHPNPATAPESFGPIGPRVPSKSPFFHLPNVTSTPSRSADIGMGAIPEDPTPHTPPTGLRCKPMMGKHASDGWGLHPEDPVSIECGEGDSSVRGTENDWEGTVPRIDSSIPAFITEALHAAPAEAFTVSAHGGTEKKGAFFAPSVVDNRDRTHSQSSSKRRGTGIPDPKELQKVLEASKKELEEAEAQSEESGPGMVTFNAGSRTSSNRSISRRPTGKLDPDELKRAMEATKKAEEEEEKKAKLRFDPQAEANALAREALAESQRSAKRRGTGRPDAKLAAQLMAEEDEDEKSEGESPSNAHAHFDDAASQASSNRRKLRKGTGWISPAAARKAAMAQDEEEDSDDPDTQTKTGCFGFFKSCC